MDQQGVSRPQTALGVVAAILVLVAVTLWAFPMDSCAPRAARKATCQTHMKQLVMAFKMYTADYNGVLPSSAICRTSDRGFRGTLGKFPPPNSRGYKAATIFELLYPYVKDKDVYFCPSDPAANIRIDLWFYQNTYPIRSLPASAKTSYVLRKSINQAWLDPKVKARRITDYNWPANQVAFYERSSYHWGGGGDVSYQKNTGKGGTNNFAFMDGHIKALRLPMIKDGEPDYYNTDGKTGTPTKRPEIDPRRYCDTLN